MKSPLVFLVTLMAALASEPGAAADRACLIEGSFEIMGQTIHAKDCMQSKGQESEAAFKASCAELADMSAQFGGKPGEVSYMATCPTPAQGVCEGLLGSDRDAYYYARSPDDLSTLPASCAAGGGRWKNGG